jgi:hypothetical protein
MYRKIVMKPDTVRISAAIKALLQVCSGFEVGDALLRYRYTLSALGVATQPRWACMYTEHAESAYLYAAF